LTLNQTLWALCAPGIALAKRVAKETKETIMNQIIYIVGAVVIVLAILSFVGLG